MDSVYGTTKKSVEEARARGKNVILDVDTIGAMKIRALCPDATLVYILPPSWDELKSRLSSTGIYNKEEVNALMEIVLDVAKDCVERQKLNAQRSFISLTYLGESARVLGNRDQLDELCQNLCDNAIRYNRPGGKVQLITSCTRDGHCIDKRRRHLLSRLHRKAKPMRLMLVMIRVLSQNHDLHLAKRRKMKCVENIIRRRIYHMRRIFFFHKRK